MKHRKIISAILSLTIIASQASRFVPNGTAKKDGNALTAYAYTENVSGNWIQNKNTGKWWYKHTDGSYTKNSWEKINNYWYHFDIYGWMQTGWLQLSGKWYYLDPKNGYMHTGWIQYKGKWYYLNPNGDMHIGWLEYKDKTYYLFEDGAMVTGLLELDDGVYYFGDDGALINYAKFDVPSYYTVTAKSGVNVRSSRSTANSNNIVGAAVYGKDCIITEIVDGWGYTEAINCTNGKKSGWIYLENMTKGWPCKVVASSLNLRKNPGSTAASNTVLEIVPKDTVVIVNIVKKYSEDNIWVETSYNGKKGWLCFLDSNQQYCYGVSDWGIGF